MDEYMDTSIYRSMDIWTPEYRDTHLLMDTNTHGHLHVYLHGPYKGILIILYMGLNKHTWGFKWPFTRANICKQWHLQWHGYTFNDIIINIIAHADWQNEECLECGGALWERERGREREKERGRERKRERITHADLLTTVRACFMLARVRTPSSPVRERERERERERDVEYGYWIYFIAFNNGRIVIFILKSMIGALAQVI